MSLARMKDLPIEIETLVVDNGSMDGTVEYLQENELTFKGIGLRVAYNSENVGLSRATDQAYQRARGNWILLCNPDVAFNRGFLELLRYGTSHTDAIMTTDGSRKREGPEGSHEAFSHRHTSLLRLR